MYVKKKLNLYIIILIRFEIIKSVRNTGVFDNNKFVRTCIKSNVSHLRTIKFNNN